MQVPAEEPLDGAVPLLRRLLGEDALGGVDTEQVVPGVPAGQILGEQVGAGELDEQARV